MRLGVVWNPTNAAVYRAIEPMRAMERRGHEVVWPADREGEADPRRLRGCDVVHVYRRLDEDTKRALPQLVNAGAAITYDNDDDLASIPKESPSYKKHGGLEGRRLFGESVKLARAAHAFTTTSEVLADRYREAGVTDVQVIANYVPYDTARPRSRHKGVVIGWIAGLEHMADVARIGIADALRQILAKHADVRVECIGVDLRLPDRYRHDRLIAFSELPARMGGFDIGIAPLADLPLNRARSDIKVKEYAASEVPWLASPVGPYVGLGEEQGGRLVPDDDWFQTLDRLVSNRRERRRLARQGKAWAKRQTTEAVADRWERVFEGAVAGFTASRSTASSPDRSLVT